MEQVVNEFDAYIRQFGVSYSGWYAGIATDPHQRLFGDHAVNKDRDAWKFANCGTDAAARWIEQHFLNLGCKGGPGGGDSATRYFYVYRVAAHTNENN